MEHQKPISKSEIAAQTEDVVGVDVPPLVRLLPPLRKGEAREKPCAYHHDVRNDGPSCFGHPGVTWCETCDAGYGSDKWRETKCSPKCPKCNGHMMWVKARDFKGWVCMDTPCCSFRLPNAPMEARPDGASIKEGSL
jgi:hypothetical protein